MATYNLYPPDVRDGPIKTLITEQIPGNEDINIHSPDLFGVKQYWRLLNGYFRAESDATVKNRYIKFWKQCAYSQRVGGFGSDALAASGVKEMILGQFDYASTVGYEAQIAGSRPDAIIIGNGTYIKIRLYDGVVGDLHLAVLEFQYMNRKYGMPDVYPKIWGVE